MQSCINFCFVETCLKTANRLILPDSKIRVDRQSALGRGVMTIAKKECFAGLEHTAVCVNTHSKIIITIYCPPSMALVAFVTKLQMLLKSLPSGVPTII